MPEAAEILTEALSRPIAFTQTPIEQVRQYSKETALMLEWFERVGYSADIAGLEREFGRALTKLPDWARRVRPLAGLKEGTHEICQIVEYGGQLWFNDVRRRRSHATRSW